jgi:hypothetical protein
MARRTRRSLAERLPDLGRFVLLCGAVLGAATAWAWNTRPEWLARIHANAVHAHVDGPRARGEALRREFERLRQQGGDLGELITALRAESRALERAQPGDRRFGTRLEIERLLARALVAQGDPMGAAEVAERAIALSALNLPHTMDCATILAGAPETRARADVVFNAALARFPRIPVIARSWIETLPLGVHDPAARSILERHLAAAREPVDSMEGLDLPWRARSDGAEQVLRPFHSERAYALRFDCDALPASLVIEPPVDLELALGALRLTFAVGDERHSIDAVEVARAAGFEVSAGETADVTTVYFTRTARRTLEFSVPEQLRGRAGSLTLQGSFGRRPRWMEQVLE